MQKCRKTFVNDCTIFLFAVQYFYLVSQNLIFSDFKFSTQFVSTLLVAFIAVFEVCLLFRKFANMPSDVSLQALKKQIHVDEIIYAGLSRPLHSHRIPVI